MTTVQHETERLGEDQARRAEADAGYILAELKGDGIAEQVAAGGWDELIAKGQAMAATRNGQVFGVFKCARTFEGR